MNLLFLGCRDTPLIKWLRLQGEIVTVMDIDINGTRPNHDFIISYGYRHIIKEPIINQYKNRIINLHISYLPFNRGVDPNFWSWHDGTPKGVTIHKIDKDIDTGDILVQKEIEISIDETLKSSYYILHREIQQLFKDNWKDIKEGNITPTPQGKGTYHNKADFKKHLLTKGWQTKCSELYDRAYWDNLKQS